MHRVEINNTVLEIDLYLAGMHRKEYDVYLRAGKWFSDKALMVICDGGDPTNEKCWTEKMFDSGVVEETNDPTYRIVKLKV